MKQMKQQLLSLGVCEDKIYHFYDLAQLFASGKARIPLQFYLNAEEIIQSKDEMKSKVLLISTDLTLADRRSHFSCGSDPEKTGIQGSLCIYVGWRFAGKID